jgi:hypothetical protein
MSQFTFVTGATVDVGDGAGDDGAPDGDADAEALPDGVAAAPSAD